MTGENDVVTAYGIYVFFVITNSWRWGSVGGASPYPASNTSLSCATL